MRKIIAFILMFGFLACVDAYSQDNIFGDYLMGGYEKTVSLDLEGAQLVDVLKMLSQQSGFNFVSTEAVRSRTLTLYIEDVPLREAMDIIFSANHLSYDYYPDSDMFIIKEMGKPDLEVLTKVYRLKYVRVESARMQQDIDTLMKPKSAEGEEEEETKRGDEEEGIKAAVQSVLTEYGKVTVDPITNSLTVIDVPSRFPLIDQVVSQLDVPLAKVMIEVEMLDVSKDTVDRLGVNWPTSLASLHVNGTRETSFPFGNRLGLNGAGRTLNADSGELSDTWDWGNWNATKFGPSILTVVGAELALNFLRTQTDTKSLARPKILTISNETAQIQIINHQTVSVSVYVDQEAGITTYTPDRWETGSYLRVTPQVDEITKEITLFVETRLTETQNSSFTITDNNYVAGTILDPEERSTKSVVRLQQGQTLFLGGLIRSTVNDVNTKVPLLGDVPVLGRLFRHRAKNVEERELLVFITPRIIGDSTILAQSNIGSFQREQFATPRRQSMKLALDAFAR
ncbi:MAG: type II secretion system protein GspD [Candidatus Omnitrophica bacterium]|nr:type II secretion system protein GspD [Candidatus Omnitrophota bacterium]